MVCLEQFLHFRDAFGSFETPQRKTTGLDSLKENYFSSVLTLNIFSKRRESAICVLILRRTPTMNITQELQLILQ